MEKNQSWRDITDLPDIFYSSWYTKDDVFFRQWTASADTAKNCMVTIPEALFSIEDLDTATNCGFLYHYGKDRETVIRAWGVWWRLSPMCDGDHPHVLTPALIKPSKLRVFKLDLKTGISGRDIIWVSHFLTLTPPSGGLSYLQTDANDSADKCIAYVDNPDFGIRPVLIPTRAAELYLVNYKTSEYIPEAWPLWKCERNNHIYNGSTIVRAVDDKGEAYTDPLKLATVLREGRFTGTIGFELDAITFVDNYPVIDQPVLGFRLGEASKPFELAIHKNDLRTANDFVRLYPKVPFIQLGWAPTVKENHRYDLTPFESVLPHPSDGLVGGIYEPGGTLALVFKTSAGLHVSVVYSNDLESGMGVSSQVTALFAALLHYYHNEQELLTTNRRREDQRTCFFRLYDEKIEAVRDRLVKTRWLQGN